MEQIYARERLPVEAEDCVELQPAEAVDTREEAAEALEGTPLLYSAPIRIGSAGTAGPPPLNDDSSGFNSVHLFQQAYGNTATLKRYGPAVQAKLQTSQPGDAYEAEADRITDMVVKMPPDRHPSGST